MSEKIMLSDKMMWLSKFLRAPFETQELWGLAVPKGEGMSYAMVELVKNIRGLSRDKDNITPSVLFVTNDRPLAISRLHPDLFDTRMHNTVNLLFNHGSYDLSTLFSLLERAYHTHNLKAVLIDGMHLFKQGRKMEDLDRQAEALIALRKWALEYNVFVMVGIEAPMRTLSGSTIPPKLTYNLSGLLYRYYNNTDRQIMLHLSRAPRTIADKWYHQSLAPEITVAEHVVAYARCDINNKQED